jgi:hypothetical protein
LVTLPFAFSFSLLDLALALSITFPVSFENASVTLPFTFTVPIAITVTVAIKSRVARRPSHERFRIWESRPRGRRRKTGGAGPNVDAEIGRWTGCALAGGHELISETRYFLFVLLADFSVLRLEVIEALTNNVEFIDLAGHWNEPSNGLKLRDQRGGYPGTNL